MAYEEQFDDGLVDDDLAQEIDAPDEDAQRDIEIQAFITRAAEEAVNWRAEELDDEMAEATDFYHGRPFGDEQPGRSRVVSTDVRDTVQAMLPSLMRIFFNSENVVEYQPRNVDDVESAKQATDYINYVVRQENGGFMVVYSALKDALVRKLGIIKWWHEDDTEVEGYEYSGLDQNALVALQSDEDNEVEITGRMVLGGGELALYDATVTRTEDKGGIKLDAIPPEELFFTPNARGRDHSEIIGHIREVPASTLVDMGYTVEEVDQYKGKSSGANGPSTSAESLKSARRFDQDYRHEMSDERDDAREMVLYGELYAHIGAEDGTAPLHRVYTMGDKYEIVDLELANEIPFALFCPDPEPHTIIGLSVHDYVKDIQRIKSNILRGALDSLTMSLQPRTQIVEGEVNMADVMNTEAGAIVRVTKPGMLEELVTPFVGKDALPMLDYMDQTKENRTGISKAAAGLDADALQSATKAAVAATLTGAQQHIELVARIFAETGFKQLYRGLLGLACRHQDQEKMVKLRNEWVPVNPASWDVTMDVTVNVALGAGSTEERMQILQLVYADQKEQILQGSPLVGFTELRATASRLIEMAGYPNVQEFYKPFGPEEEQQYQQQQAQKGSDDPQMKALELTREVEQGKLALEQQKAIWKHEEELAKMEMDFAIKQATAEAQYGAQISNQEVMADVQAAKAIIDAGAKEQAAKLAAKQQAEAAAQQPQGAAPNGQ